MLISKSPKVLQTTKIIISGGGTGGHIFPAIAIANALKKRDSSIDILFVGAKDKLEMEKVPKAGYPIKGLWISGFHRKLTLQNLLFPVKVLSSLIKSFSIVRSFKPDVAVGVGGYASGPLLQVANWFSVPSLIQEQNSYPGVTNRLLAKGADKICVVYDNLGQFFPKEKIVLTGNPVRASILNLNASRQEALAHFNLEEDKKILLVTGGSLGAKGVNEGLAAHLKELASEDLQIIWQAGKFYTDWAKEQAKDYPNVKVLTFIDRMDLAYIAADAVLSRAGGVIAELCIVGKPVLLMPSPNVAEDHQTANAKALVNKNAALMVRDNEAKDKLLTALRQLLFDENLRQTLSQNIQQLAITDAAERIADEVLGLIKK